MERGHEIHFFSYDLPHRLNGEEKNFNFHHVDVPLYPVFRFPPYTLALATAIAKSAEEDQLDIVHVHYAIPQSTSALLAKLMSCYYNAKRLRIITTLHGTDIELVGNEPNYKPVVEFSINSSDAVTAVSHYLKAATMETFDVRKEIRVIHNPIDTHLFRPAGEGTDGRSEEGFTILHVSNFRPVKRVEDAVKILDLVRNTHNARLVFLGEGPELPHAQRTARQLGVADRVFFEGRTDQVPEWLRKADLLLSTSELESFGMTIAEAMASQLPVVAYKVGGVPEVVEDGVQGRLVRKGDICAAAKAVADLLANQQLRQTYGIAARKRILEHFELEKITSEYEICYQEVLNSKPASLVGMTGDCD
jgi:N-acetyl-alpha-D-glucosaminyl L-malate synthase BshA